MHLKTPKKPARLFFKNMLFFFINYICTCVKLCKQKWVIHICKPDPNHEFLEEVGYLSLLDNGLYKIEIDNFG